MRLCSSIVEVEQLTSLDREVMFNLMLQCYENIFRDKFEEDLDAKWAVIQVHDPNDGRLVGFSTQVMLEAATGKQPIVALFSGDTVVRPSHWGDPALAHEWGQLALKLIDQHPAGNLYWFLTSKGFRTYRYLPLFFQEFAPGFNAEPTHEQSAVIDTLGKLVGGDRYDPIRRVILATSNKDFVYKSMSEPGARTNDPHVSFFVERNPGYQHGDELCCIAPLTRQNFTRAAYRVINAKSVNREAI